MKHGTGACSDTAGRILKDENGTHKKNLLDRILRDHFFHSLVQFYVSVWR